MKHSKCYTCRTVALMVVYHTCLIQALFVQMFVQQQDMEHWTEVRMNHVEEIRAVKLMISKGKSCTKDIWSLTAVLSSSRRPPLGDSWSCWGNTRQQANQHCCRIEQTVGHCCLFFYTYRNCMSSVNSIALGLPLSTGTFALRFAWEAKPNTW